MLVLRELVSCASGVNWSAEGTAIGPLLVSEQLRFSPVASDGFTISRHEERPNQRGGTALVTGWRGPAGIEVDLAVTSFCDVGVVEFQSSLRNRGPAPIKGVSSLGPLVLRIRPGDGQLRLHWLDRGASRVQSADLRGDFSISGGSWNAPGAAGWLAIEDREKCEILFVGVQWESYWRISLARDGSDIVLAGGLERFERDLGPGAELATPVWFVGVSHGDLDDSLRCLHDYLRLHVMPSPPEGFPWVTYDIWGTEAEGVEEGISSEIPFARDVGVELFYYDASWYAGSCRNGSGDWFTGVGNWGSDDRAKLPHGLASLSRQVHGAGMKFGLWFAPQVVDSQLVGTLVPDRWVARNNGADLALDLRNGWAPITQVCLGDPEVVDYLDRAMSSAVERYDLDWLKWDNSGLAGPVCNRDDHGHSSGDGPLAALRGQYRVFEHLHTRFPDLVLESCGYPSRVDYGSARYARAYWLSDDTSDAVRCRRGQIHGSYVLPSGLDTAWVVKCGELDNQQDPALLDCIVRSRMIGLFGMGTLTGTLPERVSLMSLEVRDALKRNIASYKRYRHLLLEDVYHVLPLADTPDQWDGIQFAKRDGSEAVLIVFRNGSPDADMTVRLRGLRRAARYTMTSLNTGHETKALGAGLMNRGVSALLPRQNTSEVYLITAAR